MLKFDFVVSLGAWCQTAYQIENHGLAFLPNCFDWLVTPWPAMTSILRTDGKLLGMKGVLNVGAQSTTCGNYGVLYHHEFPKDRYGLPVITPRRLAKARSKLVHKYQKFHSALSSGEVVGSTNVLFVRLGGRVQPPLAWPYIVEQSTVTAEELNDLLALLQGKFPRINPKLLFVWQEPFSQISLHRDGLNANIFAAPLAPPPPGETPWEGIDSSWTRVFEQAFKHWGVETRLNPLGLRPNGQSQDPKLLFSDWIGSILRF